MQSKSVVHQSRPPTHTTWIHHFAKGRLFCLLQCVRKLVDFEDGRRRKQAATRQIIRNKRIVRILLFFLIDFPSHKKTQSSLSIYLRTSKMSSALIFEKPLDKLGKNWVQRIEAQRDPGHGSIQTQTAPSLIWTGRPLYN